MDFAARLRAAVSASDLSLEQISAALGQRGTPVSRSSLSGWQSGISRPERPASLRALAELEQLLGLEPDELRESLPPRLRRGRTASAPLDPADTWENPDAVRRVLARLGAMPNDPTDPLPVAQRLLLSVDEHGIMRSLAISTLVQSRRNGTDRLISVSTDDEIQDAPQVVNARGATVGRFRADPASAVSAYELLLPRPLDVGELAAVDYTEHFTTRADGTELTLRMHPGARLMILGVQFNADRPPAACHAFFQPGAAAPEQELERVDGPLVQLIRLDPTPGIYGIRWEW